MFHGSNTTTSSHPASKSHATKPRHDRICRIVQRNVARVACECAREAAGPTTPSHPIRPWRRAA
jgi:hypothetical protein